MCLKLSNLTTLPCFHTFFSATSQSIIIPTCTYITFLFFLFSKMFLFVIISISAVDVCIYCLPFFRQIILYSRLLVSCVLCPSLSLRVHTLELMVESSMSEPLELRSQSSQWKVHHVHYTECVYYIYVLSLIYPFCVQ